MSAGNKEIDQLRAAMDNKLHLAMVMYNERNKYINRRLVSAADPSDVWHSQQNINFRSLTEGLVWQIQQVGGHMHIHIALTVKQTIDATKFEWVGIKTLHSFLRDNRDVVSVWDKDEKQVEIIEQNTACSQYFMLNYVLAWTRWIRLVTQFRGGHGDSLNFLIRSSCQEPSKYLRGTVGITRW